MDATIVFILAAICAFIGFFLGLAISATRKEKPEGQNDKAVARSGLVEEARVFSDGGGKKVFLQLGGRFVRAADDLNPKQRAYLIALFQKLYSWLAGVASTEVDARQGQVTPSMNTQTGIPSISPKPGLEADSRPGTEPRLKIKTVEVLARALQVDVPKPAPKSIAAQVDEILQERISGTPLEKWGVRLVELPGKDIAVMVGLQQYSAVGDVPDPAIRDAIRAAVVEWEKKTPSE